MTNFGTIIASRPAQHSNGFAISGSGTVTNGSATDTKATVIGNRHGVYIRGGAGSGVSNFGTIIGEARPGVGLYLGGTVTNGPTALISGSARSGVYLGDVGAVFNFGTISSTGRAGVNMEPGGTLGNGSATDTAAVISMTGTISGDHSGVYTVLGSATITSYGTISAASASGISIGNGTDRGTNEVTNFGTITGTSGIFFNPNVAGTVINAGVITNASGTAGTAITFGNLDDRLVVDPGASFTGHVFGGGGSNTLELAAGAAGSVTGIGTKFQSFATLALDSGASWTLPASNSATTTLDTGTLNVGTSGTFNAGTVDPSSTGMLEISTSSNSKSSV